MRKNEAISGPVAVLLAGASLVCGAMVYIALRNTMPPFVGFLAEHGFDAGIAASRRLLAPIRDRIPEAILLSGPSAFWSFSYALVMMELWWGSGSRMRYVWLGSVPVVVFGWEFLQYVHIAPGTGSLGDVMSSIVGCALGVSLILLARRRHE